jgi:hypothetical protein
MRSIYGSLSPRSASVIDDAAAAIPARWASDDAVATRRAAADGSLRGRKT